MNEERVLHRSPASRSRGMRMPVDQLSERLNRADHPGHPGRPVAVDAGAEGPGAGHSRAPGLKGTGFQRPRAEG